MRNEELYRLQSSVISWRIDAMNWAKYLESSGDLSFRNNLAVIVMQTEAVIRKAEDMKGPEAAEAEDKKWHRVPWTGW